MMACTSASGLKITLPVARAFRRLPHLLRGGGNPVRSQRPSCAKCCRGKLAGVKQRIDDASEGDAGHARLRAHGQT